MFRLVAVLGLPLISGIISIAPSPSASVHASQATPTAGGDLVYVPIADALVEAASPNTNHGNSPNLRADGGKDPAVESYLMVLGQRRSRADRPRRSPYIRDVRHQSGTGRLRPPRVGRRPGSPGPTARHAPPIRLPPRPVTPDTWVEFDVTAVVTGNGTYSFVLATSSADGLNFSARESGQTAPQLVITPGDRSLESPSPVASPVSADTAIVLAAGDVTSCKSTGPRRPVS